MKTTTRTIIDSTSGDPIRGTIGRFAVTSYRRGEGMEHGTPGVFEGVRYGFHHGRGKRALTAALIVAEGTNADRTRAFYTIVSLYDAGMKTWWPCELTDAE